MREGVERDDIIEFNLPKRKTKRKQAVQEKHLFLDMLSLIC